MILSIIAAVLGIIGTILTYKLNPKQKLYDQLDQLAKKKVSLERWRDEALQKNDTDSLTAAGNALIKLQHDEASILQRLREISSRK